MAQRTFGSRLHQGLQAWRGWRAASAAALIAAGAVWAAPAQADTVRVLLRELPAGLTISAVTARTECRDGGVTHVEASRVPLVESSLTTYDTVQLPGGQTVVRPRVLIFYSAQFVVNPSPLSVRCSLLGIGPDFSTSALVFGAGPRLASSRSLGLADYVTGGALVNIDRVLEAKSLSLRNAMAQPFTELRRGQLAIVLFSNRDPFGQASIDEATLTLSLPGPIQFGGVALFQAVVTMKVNRAGRACITAGGTTRCAGDATGPLIHGGVRLEGFSIKPAPAGPNFLTDAEASFRFIPQPEFAPGTYRVSGAANDRDLLAYLVDGRLEVLDLLPWRDTALQVPVR